MTEPALESLKHRINAMRFGLPARLTEVFRHRIAVERGLYLFQLNLEISHGISNSRHAELNNVQNTLRHVNLYPLKVEKFNKLLLFRSVEMEKYTIA